MAEGIAAAGDVPVLAYEHEFAGQPVADAAVFYGLEGRLPHVFAAYKGIGRAVYVDLGYWDRRRGGRFAGFHKIAVNARHPTAYFRRPAHPPDRLRAVAAPIKPWRRNGRHVLVAGMGDKGARAEGYATEAWERWAIGELQRYTARPIVYRPKPSWKKARPIAGTIYSPRTREVADELRDCWAVVTHHSNVAVDAIMAGVPAFCWEGVAACMSGQELAGIESPPMPDGREQWAADIAYTQWSVEEMRTGAAWRHLRQEGLL
jgi:hypothetical protein